MLHPNRKSPSNNRPLPEVAERQTEKACPDQELNLSIDSRTGELEDLSTFKVFLKKNLPYQAPPADLLANIYDRIDAIKADQP